jgi:Holliday junction resolvase RusA-like endonuclease
MKQIEIKISPLRVSKAWQGRRFKTAEYKKWQLNFSRLVGKHSPLRGKIALICEFYIKNDKMSDIDNFLKTLQDTLKDCGVIEDDRFIYELHCYKYHSEKEFIRITIENL